VYLGNRKIKKMIVTEQVIFIYRQKKADKQGTTNKIAGRKKSIIMKSGSA
jgi:hypothetical protein